MDSLKNFIDKNRNEFEDNLDFDEKMWQEIAPKVQKKSKIVFFSSKNIRRLAAAVLLLLGSVWVFYQKNAPVQSPAHAELQEAQNYYSAMISQKMQVIQTHQNNLDPMLLNDLAGMDSALKELQNDLKDNAANQEVVSAMIQHYRLKLRILEEIESQINEKEDEKSTHSL